MSGERVVWHGSDDERDHTAEHRVKLSNEEAQQDNTPQGENNGNSSN